MNDQDEIAVKVENLTKSFKIPLEGSSGLKQKIINGLKGRKGYRTYTPLNDISFEVCKGDFFGIVGRNGSGKSTLLKTMANIYTPTKGAVHVNGTLVPFIELGVGFNPELTGRENVFLNGALLGFSRKEMEDMYDEIVDFSEIGDFMEEKLKNYSSGMQVRLAFSIAIEAQGDVLLLDEVLAVGDAAFQQKCFDYFDELRRKRKTVILVTHDMGAVERFCNRAMIIENGVIKAIGDPNDIADIYRAENIIQEKPNNDQELSDTTSKAIAKLTISVNDATDTLIFTFVSSNIYPQGTYVGFSLFKDGRGFAELNSSAIKNQTESITYSLEKSFLNPGVYEVSAALFKRSNGELISISQNKKKFIIRGSDLTRGGGMRLPYSWENNNH